MHRVLSISRQYYSSYSSQRYTKPAKTAPTMGASQNSHSWANAQSPWNMATPVLLAGLTEVLVACITGLACLDSVWRLNPWLFYSGTLSLIVDRSNRSLVWLGSVINSGWVPGPIEIHCYLHVFADFALRSNHNSPGSEWFPITWFCHYRLKAGSIRSHFWSQMTTQKEFQTSFRSPIQNILRFIWLT